MDSKELWEVFAKSGDIELYGMYKTLKEEEQAKWKNSKQKQ